jgi:hypothetical protein
LPGRVFDGEREGARAFWRQQHGCSESERYRLHRRLVHRRDDLLDLVRSALAEEDDSQMDAFRRDKTDPATSTLPPCPGGQFLTQSNRRIHRHKNAHPHI